jgi:hypothetical protein
MFCVSKPVEIAGPCSSECPTATFVAPQQLTPKINDAPLQILNGFIAMDGIGNNQEDLNQSLSAKGGFR